MGAGSTHGMFDDIVRSDSSLRRVLHGLPGVDQVGCEARAAGLGTRSITTLSTAPTGMPTTPARATTAAFTDGDTTDGATER